jgi:uncharacterized protein (DUF433 family)
MTTATEHPHVVREPAILGGEPIVKGTRTPVRAIVEMWRLGCSPEEIVAGLPHLRLGQVFDALAFFEDHAEEILEHIDRNHIGEHLLPPTQL